MTDSYHLYILECTDGSLYTGITTDVERRLKEHKEGNGAKYTRAKGVKKLVYSEKCLERGSATRREMEIKRMSKDEKKKLIVGL
jgi:putative endonuclease